ncbi:MAG: BACON domain-containing protein, partial [Bacteroidaceae bacterium]|nr:BACON domain-containing protein [Bacteroidaceae bacterium]
MRKSHILSRLMVMAFMLCVAAVALAQNGDKLFIDGQKLQQTMTVASQNAAIQKFKAAKVAYTTADKKKMCDNQIAICNKNISQIKRGGGGGSGKKGAPQTASTATTSTKFSVSHSNIIFDGDKAGSLNVRVDAPTKNWKFSVPAGVGGMDNFLKVTRSNDAKSIDISVEANDQTLVREQVIQIDYGDNQKEIRVRQLGKSVTLSTDHHQVEFGLKGGKKSREVYTNSDSIIST